MTGELDEDTRLKLMGLRAIARDLNKQMEAVRKTVARLTGDDPEDKGSWSGDFVWDDSITVDRLWERTADKRAAS